MSDTEEHAIVDHEQFGVAHDALNRMKRASDRGTGCYLTAEMIERLSVTFMGELWSSPDPRKVKS